MERLVPFARLRQPVVHYKIKKGIERDKKKKGRGRKNSKEERNHLLERDCSMMGTLIRGHEIVRDRRSIQGLSGKG